MSQAYQRTFQAWAKQFQEEHLSPEVQKLISQANADLWYGPFRDGSFGDPTDGDEEWDNYPGFVSATDRIKQDLEDVPDCLYIDDDCEGWFENEPEPEKCDTCNGQGETCDEQGDLCKCYPCNGLGCFETFGDWWKVDRSDLLKALVGKELVQYVR